MGRDGSRASPRRDCGRSGERAAQEGLGHAGAGREDARDCRRGHRPNGPPSSSYRGYRGGWWRTTGCGRGPRRRPRCTDAACARAGEPGSVGRRRGAVMGSWSTALLAPALALVACAGCATQLPLPALDQVDRVRSSQGVASSAELAPDLFSRAEQARADAHAAHAAGDDVAATLRAERATAAYTAAVASARTVRATLELASAQHDLDVATA